MSKHNVTKVGHTPGPWTHKHHGKFSIVESTDGSVAAMTPQRKEFRANGALIAAAPELLEALKAVQANNKLMNALNGQDRKTLELIQAAIAKAEGK